MSSLRTIGATALLVVSGAASGQSAFVAFESEQFRPLALSPDRTRLFAVNTPDNRLEILDASGTLAPIASVPVGLEPVAVAARTDTEVWVVNHLSDSVSIVDLSGAAPRVVRTLLVGDEPRDIVFAGPGNSRAFITAAHRGQNSPYTDPVNPGQFTTPGIGRTDVWVFDAANPGAGSGGSPLQVMTFFGDSAGPLAATPDGTAVYVGVFKSGNRTTILAESHVCNGGETAQPCQPVPGEATAPGGLPAPNADTAGITAPETGLIVRHDGTAWRDELGRDWSPLVRFALPDQDVFRIAVGPDGSTSAGDAFSGVGTVLFGMAVNPVSGRLYVSNTEANNAVRFAGLRPAGSTITSVNGNLAKARITVIDPATASVSPRHLNKHIDYGVIPAPTSVRDRSLASPGGIVVSADGATLWVAAKGSDRVGVFATAGLENDSFTPDAANHVVVTGGGPSGLALDEARRRLYVMTRFDNGVSVVDTATRAEVGHVRLFNPEPASIVNGRRFLYDARLTSGNGEASCASCHVAADKDELAWDLGDPFGTQVDNPNPFVARAPLAPPPVFHAMKGPFVTQTLRGMATHGPMHWRGDKSGALEPGGDALDEEAAFKQFNGAFTELQGRATPLTDAEMQAFTDFVLQLMPPPNPVRNLDNSLTPMQLAGRNAWFNQVVNAFGARCNTCHVLNPAAGFFGADGRTSAGAAPSPTAQFDFKTPQERNLYEKVGMFGMAGTPLTIGGSSAFTGNQVRGFGFMHDGSFDTLMRRLQMNLFNLPGGDAQRRNLEQFMFAFDSNLAPVVGQQVTLGPASGTFANGRVDLLVARAAAGDADLVVHGRVGGVRRGWLRQGDGTFRPDRAGEPALSESALRALAAAGGQELTFTAVPPGSGTRIGIDRDADAATDGDDNCTQAANTNQRDTNGDGFGNLCDADLNNNGVVNATDLAIFRLRFGSADPDADLDGNGFVNAVDLALFRSLFGRAPGPSALAP